MKTNSRRPILTAATSALTPGSLPGSLPTSPAASSTPLLAPLTSIIIAALGLALMGCEMAPPEADSTRSGTEKTSTPTASPFLSADKLRDYSPEEDSEGRPLWALRQGAIVDLQGEWKLRDSYWGQQLALEPNHRLQPHTKANGLIFISGEDAEALYQNLNVATEDLGLRSTQQLTEMVREKRSHLAACQESENRLAETKTYRCALGIDYRKGEFVQWPYPQALFYSAGRDHHGSQATLIQPRAESLSPLAQGLLLVQLEGHEARLLFDNMEVEGQLTEAYWQAPPGFETAGTLAFEMATEKRGPNLSCRRFSQLAAAQDASQNATQPEAAPAVSQAPRGPALYQCFLEVSLSGDKAYEEPKTLMARPKIKEAQSSAVQPKKEVGREALAESERNPRPNRATRSIR